MAACFISGLKSIERGQMYPLPPEHALWSPLFALGGLIETFGHAAHEPPQSTPVSFPSFLSSRHCGSGGGAGSLLASAPASAAAPAASAAVCPDPGVPASRVPGPDGPGSPAFDPVPSPASCGSAEGEPPPASLSPCTGPGVPNPPGPCGAELQAGAPTTSRTAADNAPRENRTRRCGPREVRCRKECMVDPKPVATQRGGGSRKRNLDRLVPHEAP